MTNERHVPTPHQASPRGSAATDDLGLPLESDPGDVALAFLALTREWDVPASHRSDPRASQDAVDLGLPTESDPDDFVRAFFAIRDPQLPPRF